MTAVLSLLGGGLALDQTGLGQFMVARPLVSATLGGWILGDPVSGLAAGALLEALFLPAFPVGGARFPEAGPAGIVAAVAAVEGAGPGGLALGVALGAVWGLVGGWTVTLQRRVNERFAAVPETGRVRPLRVVGGHLGALACDFGRGALLTLGGVLVARLAVPVAGAGWPLSRTDTLLGLGAVAALAVGGLLEAVDGWERRKGLLVGGLVVGMSVGWFL